MAKPFSPVWSGLIAACVTLLAAGGLAWHVAGRHSETQVADAPPEAVPTVARAEPPDPALLAGWVHAAVLPAPVRPMALVAHLAAMEELARASDALVSIQIPRRPLRGDIPPLEPAAPPPEFLMPWSRLAL